jgi:anti-sigma factor RsiW
MNPFEEQFTAWVDGKLSGKELEAFETELAAHPEAAHDKADMLRIGALLRQHSTVPRLTNLDFFNHQIMERIAAETPRLPAPAERRPFFWPLRRLVLAGGLSLAVALGLFEAFIPKTPDGDRQRVKAWSEDPRITASTFYDSDQNVTVVWLDGLDYVTRDIAQQ